MPSYFIRKDFRPIPDADIQKAPDQVHLGIGNVLALARAECKEGAQYQKCFVFSQSQNRYLERHSVDMSVGKLTGPDDPKIEKGLKRLQKELNKIVKSIDWQAMGPSFEVHVIVELKGDVDDYIKFSKRIPSFPGRRINFYIIEELPKGALENIRRNIISIGRFRIIENPNKSGPYLFAKVPRKPTYVPKIKFKDLKSQLFSSEDKSLWRNLKLTLKHHGWYRILLPTVILGFFALPINPGSIWPQGVAWLLSNALPVILISLSLFATGYLFFQFSKRFFSNEDKQAASPLSPDAKPEKNPYYYTKKIGQIFMGFSVIPMLILAFVNPAITAFIRNLAIGDGVLHGFMTQLCTFNVIGIVPLLVGIAISFILGVIITAGIAFILKQKEEATPQLSRTKSKVNLKTSEGFITKAFSAIKDSLFYWVAKLGVTLVYGSIWMAILLMVTRLSMFILGPSLGLSLGVVAVVGPVLLKAIAKVGYATRWLSLYTGAFANFLMWLKGNIIYWGCGIPQYFKTRIRSNEFLRLRHQLAEEVFSKGPSSLEGKIIVSLLNLIFDGLYLLLSAIRVVLFNINNLCEVLDGKLEYHFGCDEFNSGSLVEKYYEVQLRDSTLEERDDNLSDPSLFCGKVQSMLALENVRSYGKLKKAFTRPEDLTISDPSDSIYQKGEDISIGRLGIGF